MVRLDIHRREMKESESITIHYLYMPVDFFFHFFYLFFELVFYP